ncbi:MAG: family 78 glycoside hydrolase catalytic domain [Spirochaetes bacterium]|nr:family 78 glycoside hydrolase catalytic domain [Spirochaetota bacterium]
MKPNARFRSVLAPMASPWGPDTRLIWLAEEMATHYETPRQSFVHFRKVFHADGAVAPVHLRVFADSRYRAFLNGALLGFGPPRSDPRWQCYDEWPVDAHLRPGENTLAIFVLHLGYGNGQHISRIPSLIAELRRGDGKILAGTDASWRCQKSGAYEASAPRVNGCQGPMEIFDARRHPWGWQELGFDDRAWGEAKVRHPSLCPFWNWQANPLPPIAEEILEAPGAFAYGHFNDFSSRESRVGARHRVLLDEEAGLAPQTSASPLPWPHTVEPPGAGLGALLTVDFENTWAGFLRIDLEGEAGTRVDAVYAESLHQGKALLNPDSYRGADCFILPGGRVKMEIAFGWKAFRYVQFRVRGPSPVVFHGVGVRSRHASIPNRAAFSSSSPSLDRLWEISAHTLRLCQQDGFLDSPSREQQQWMGDARWQAVFNRAYSGDARMHRELLVQFARSQDFEGMTTSRYPDGHHNYPPIPSFCLHWVASCREYLGFTGDLGLIAQVWPNLCLAMRWFTRFEGAHGLLWDVPYWPFIDWGESWAGRRPDTERGGAVTALNLLYLEAQSAMAELAGWIGDPEAAAYHDDRRGALAASIRERLWDDAKGAHPDALFPTGFSPSLGEATHALALLHLYEPGDARARRILESIFGGGSRHTWASPFFMPVVLRALSRHGKADLAYRLMVQRYQPMLDAGATTTWENWVLFYEQGGRTVFNSACHAWGASPLLFVSEEVLGIRVVPWSPGEGVRYAFAPRLFDLDTASGSVAAGKGMIALHLRRESGQIRCRVEIPPGARLATPLGELGEGEHRLDLPDPDADA